MTWFGIQDNKSPLITSTSSAASLLSTIASVTLGVAMFYDHFYSPRSTAFLSLFLTVSVVAEGLKSKCLPSFGELSRVATLSVGCMIAKAFLITLLETPKTLITNKEKKTKSGSTETGGLWGRLWSMGVGFHETLNKLGSFGLTVNSNDLLDMIETVWDASKYTGLQNSLH